MLVAEAGGRLAFARGKGVGEILALLDQAHALAAATGRRLDQHRVADAVGRHVQYARGLVVAVIARRQWNPGIAHQLLGFRLRAHGADRRGRRADEGDAVGSQRLGEVGILGEEAVAGVHRLRTGAQARLDDLVGDQIGFTRRSRAEQHRLVGQADMAGVGVGVRIDSDGAHAHAAGGLDDAAGDFSAVGNKNFVKHWGSPAAERRRHVRRRMQGRERTSVCQYRDGQQ